jgi:hypothetical protein
MTDERERGFWYGFSRCLLWGLLLAAAVLVLFFDWGVAWWTVPDPSDEKRSEYLNTLLNQHNGAVSARLAGGRMGKLGRSNVTEIGASQCAREYRCARMGRRSCLSVHVNFYCTYRVKDQAGNAAMAILRAYPNDFYEPNSNDPYSPWRRERHLPTNLDLNEAANKLCHLGYGCGL